MPVARLLLVAMFDVFTSMKIQVVVLWVVTPCKWCVPSDPSSLES